MTAHDDEPHGRRWRDLEEYFGRATPDVLDEVHVTAPRLGRRHFLELMGASVALASCVRQPSENIMAYVDAPEATPGLPVFYASTAIRNGYGIGIVVETHAGRPTKIEGNRHHPLSLGKTSALEQALILQLYDPARAKEFRRRGVPSGALAIHADIELVRRNFRARGGEGLALVLPPTTSLATTALLDRVRDELPRASVHFLTPMPHTNAWRGAQIAFGEAVDVVVDLSAARNVVCFDCDFIGDRPDNLRLAHDWAERRNKDFAARLFVADDGASLAFMNGDVRLRTQPSRISLVAAAVANAVIRRAAAGDRDDAGPLRDEERAFVSAAARALVDGSGVVLVGDRQPPQVHAAAHAIHAAIGALDTAARPIKSAIIDAGEKSHLPAPLFDALAAGAVDTLVTLDVNLAYAWPAAAPLVAKARQHLHASSFFDETAQGATWFVPLAHSLESWGDARAIDGTHSVMQPTVKPLYGTPSALELLARFTGAGPIDARAAVASSLRATGAPFDDILRAGFAASPSSRAPVPRESAPDLLARIDALPSTRPPVLVDGALELSLRSDLRVHHGELCNVAWLLELPDPITKLTWENAALLSPRTATALGVDDGALVEIRRSRAAVGVHADHAGRPDRPDRAGRAVGANRDGVVTAPVTAPVIVHPGVSDGVVIVHCGWGRRVDASLQDGAGFSAWSLAPFDDLGAIVNIASLGETRELARTQSHHRIRSNVVVAIKQEELTSRKTPRDLAPHVLTSLYEPPRAPGPQWGMSVDMDRCTGCSACVVACMAENNVPVVGRAEVIMRREMHWLRVDVYFEGGVEEPKPIFQPMMCQHCETAPCEYVCPVAATVHSSDGLNQMIYNRCIGTRYCSNNCPYKVRRFNWINFNANRTPVEKLAMNPDVTVRARGVMEKCTYCVQRIRSAVIASRVERREIADGEVVPACAQSCPTDAIVFGRIDDPSSRVSALRKDRRQFAALDEENTRPRTRYLARVRRGESQ